MNNIDKARKIAEHNERVYVCAHKSGESVYDEHSFFECYISAMDMAIWKDERFKVAMEELKRRLISFAENTGVDLVDNTIVEEVEKQYYKEA